MPVIRNRGLPVSPIAHLNAGGVDRSTTLEFGERLGSVFIAESAGLSALAVTILLCYISYSAVALKRGASRRWTVASYIHYYFINLLIADLIQAMGGLLSIKWIIDARISEGPYCTTQGVLKQMGDVGVALTSLAIAIQTFLSLVFRIHGAPKSALFVIGGIWTFIALIVGVGYAANRDPRVSYYGNTQYWCWITEAYPAQRFALEYFWMWFAAVGNLVCYIIIALVVQGVLVVTTKNWIKIRRKSDCVTHFKVFARPTDSASSRWATDVATQMLFYPAVYIITVSPIAIARWTAFAGTTVPFGATCFASILFSMSGLLHVILFSLTRPRLLPTRDKLARSTAASTTPAVSAPASRVQSSADESDQDIEGSGNRLGYDGPIGSALPSPEVRHS